MCGGYSAYLRTYQYLYQYLWTNNKRLNDTQWRHGPCSEDNPGEWWSGDVWWLALSLYLYQYLYQYLCTSTCSSTSTSTVACTTSALTTRAGGTHLTPRTTRVRVNEGVVVIALSPYLYQYLYQYLC